MKNTKKLLITFALVSTGAISSYGVVDFEAEGLAAGDNTPLATNYDFTDGGVTFNFIFVRDFVSGNALNTFTYESMEFEKTGTDGGTQYTEGYFTNTSATDYDQDNDPARDLGGWFIRNPSGNGTAQDGKDNSFGTNYPGTALIIDYTSGSPTAASGEIWDIDLAINGETSTSEGFKVTAYDSSNQIIGSVTKIATDNSLDSKAWVFGLNPGTPIDYIAITGAGTRPQNTGLAFNNFDAVAVPEPTTYAAILGLIGFALVIKRRNSLVK